VRGVVNYVVALTVATSPLLAEDQRDPALHHSVSGRFDAPRLLKECDGGQNASCTTLGAHYEAGDGVRRDAGRAAALYKQACDRGGLGGCMFLGLMHATGSGMPKDGAQAERLLKQACTGPLDSFECELVAGIYETGSGTVNGRELPRDLARAKLLYLAACHGGYAEACERLRHLPRTAGTREE
jgi:TPR repeat protein